VVEAQAPEAPLVTVHRGVRIQVEVVVANKDLDQSVAMVVQVL
jgi:hypothetical protein